MRNKNTTKHKASPGEAAPPLKQRGGSFPAGEACRGGSLVCTHRCTLRAELDSGLPAPRPHSCFRETPCPKKGPPPCSIATRKGTGTPHNRLTHASISSPAAKDQGAWLGCTASPCFLQVEDGQATGLRGSPSTTQAAHRHDSMDEFSFC